MLDKIAMDKWDDYEVDLGRFEEAWNGLEWLICRTPEIGVRKVSGGTTYWLYKQDSDIFAMTPVITILYTFDETQVVVKDIEATEADRSRHGTA